MDDFTSFPKYQYSVFLKNGRDEQMVIRSNDFEEFKNLKRQIDEIMVKHETKPTQTQLMTRPCSREGCQGTQTYRAGTSKAGKAYKGWFCDLSKDHVDWVK